MGGESPRKAPGLAVVPEQSRARGASSRRFPLPVWRWDSKRKAPAEPVVGEDRTARRWLLLALSSRSRSSGRAWRPSGLCPRPPRPACLDVNPAPALAAPLNPSSSHRPRHEPLHTGGRASTRAGGTQVHGKRKRDNQREGPRCVVICHRGPRKPTWLAACCPGSLGGQGDQCPWTAWSTSVHFPSRWGCWTETGRR